jgi:Putative Ig domain
VNHRFRHGLAALLVLGLLTILSGCGGGGGGGTGTQSPPPPPPPNLLTITSPAILPGTLQSAQYTYTLQAANGTGALTWSIAPVSSTALFVDGLSIDPSTGVLSGTANFGGTAGFVATVKDSASPAHTVSKGFTITAGSPLTAAPPQTLTFGQYQDVVSGVAVAGGVQPLTFHISSGVLPAGMKFNGQSGRLGGTALGTGDFPIAVTVQDSYSPPEVVTEQIDIKVLAPALSIQQSLPTQYLLNRPFSGRIVAVGGIPPYAFTLTGGSLAPGMGPIDPNTGQLNGTPTELFSQVFTVTVVDSASVPNTATANFGMNVVNPIGRNDSVSTATPIDNGQFSGTISPYIDPPATAAPGDNDYYKLTSVSGATVHVETFAARNFGSPDPLDTVLELVDGNNNRLTACRQPGDTSSSFSSSCLNDDISTSPFVPDSALDIKVPGAASTPTTFYVHVLDFRGDARPDMRYLLSVSGVADPLVITNSSLAPAARGTSYSQYLTSQNGNGTVSFTLAGGNLPPGVNLNSTGALTGTATADGSYTATFEAADSSTPPQTVTKQYTIQVVEPIAITGPAVWPDACVNQPYSFAIQTSGGIPPFFWSFVSNNWIGINLDQSTGIFSGFSSITGTFNGTVGVGDRTGHFVSQNVTVTVKPCP